MTDQTTERMTEHASLPSDGEAIVDEAPRTDAGPTAEAAAAESPAPEPPPAPVEDELSVEEVEAAPDAVPSAAAETATVEVEPAPAVALNGVDAPAESIGAPAEPAAQAEPDAPAEPDVPAEPDAPPQPMTVGRMFADVIRRAGVRWAFTVPGESFLGLLEGLQAVGINVVATRHEGAAAFMAEAHAQLTGRPAACRGPRAGGGSHRAIGIHTAYADSSPRFAFIGSRSGPPSRRT